MSTVTQGAEVRMPRLSDSMEEGTIISWLKHSGDAVQAGEPIVEIETDKATMEYEAETSGVLEIVAETGATIALGQVIARLLPPGSSPAPDAHPPQDANRARGNGRRVLATPVARRLAASLDVDLATISPSGRRGQIVKTDVLAAANANANEGGGAAPAASPATEAAPDDVPAARPVEPPGRSLREPLSSVQRTIARRMGQSRATVPDFALEVDVEMDACLAFRAELKQQVESPPSINDMIVKACALALARHPRANGSYSDDGFDLHSEVNVGIAVAAADALLVPVIRNADCKRLTEIAAESQDLARRAREGRITPPELSGATFTVSNLGMFGIDRFTAIINAPQAAILAVGAVTPQPWARDGQLGIAQVMTATLASDHRILYGADAAAFLTDVRDHLQAPLRLVA